MEKFPDNLKITQYFNFPIYLKTPPEYLFIYDFAKKQMELTDKTLLYLKK